MLAMGIRCTKRKPSKKDQYRSKIHNKSKSEADDLQV